MTRLRHPLMGLLLAGALLVPTTALPGPGPAVAAAPVAAAAPAPRATLALPAVARPDAVVRPRARFAPARAGRPVVLQVRVGSRWRTVARAAQARSGVATFRLEARSGRFRAVAPAWRGQRSVASPSAAVTEMARVGARKPWVTGYYAGWFWDQMYAPQQVDMRAMTHFVFGRVAPGGGSLEGDPGTVVFGAGTADDPGLAPDGVRTVEQYLVDRAHAAGTKALLVLGGDGDDGRGFVASTTDAHRADFVDAVVDHLVAHDYDGVDVDWENCLAGEAGCGASAGQARGQLADLIADLRAEMATRTRYAGTPGLITFPGYALNMNTDAPGGPAAAWQADVARSVDQFNLMSYGVGTTWWGHGTGWRSWFTGALTGQSPSTPVDIASSVNAYVRAGVPRSRIGIGIGFYGIYYGPHIDGPREYDRRNDIYEVQDVSLSYGELVRKGYLSHGVRHWDDRAQSTYRVFGGRGYVPRVDPGSNPAGMLSYEDRQSIAAKANYVHRTGAGGTILWTLNYGWVRSTRSNPLLAQVKASFLGR